MQGFRACGNNKIVVGSCQTERDRANYARMSRTPQERSRKVRKPAVLSVSLDQKLIERVKATARAERRTVSMVVELALEKALGGR